jgi:hypothetical protein
MGAVTCGSGKVCQGGRCVDCADGATRPCGNMLSSPCKRGTQTCRGGTWAAPCEGEVTPKPEVECNGVDEDCDGRPDNCRSGMSCMAGHCSLPLPAGDYRNTCDTCWYDGTTLRCTGCLNDSFTRAGETSIPGRCNYELSNCDGRLACRPSSAPGDYEGSCDDCNFDKCAGSNGVLTCSACNYTDLNAPPARQVRYDGPPCPAGIHNCDGALRCSC